MYLHLDIRRSNTNYSRSRLSARAVADKLNLYSVVRRPKQNVGDEGAPWLRPATQTVWRRLLTTVGMTISHKLRSAGIANGQLPLAVHGYEWRQFNTVIRCRS